MTVFGSNQGAFKEATGMWASKNGVWQPVPLGSGETPPTQYDKWSLAHSAGVPPLVDQMFLWPPTGWSAVWEGTDLVITIPPWQEVWQSYWWIGAIVIPTPLEPIPHPHSLGNPPDATHWTARWTHVIDAVELGTDASFHLLSWFDQYAIPEPGGGLAYAASTTGTWDVPLSIAETAVSLASLGFTPPPYYSTGAWGYVTFGFGATLGGITTSHTVRYTAVDCEWGFPQPAATRAEESLPTLSAEVLSKYDELMTRDTSDLSPEQRSAVDVVRRMDPLSAMPFLREQ